MKRQIIILCVLVFSLPVVAQERNRIRVPVCDYWCQLYGASSAIERVSPRFHWLRENHIGVTQAGSDMGSGFDETAQGIYYRRVEPNSKSVDDIAAHGITAVQLWPRAHPSDEYSDLFCHTEPPWACDPVDMGHVWGNPLIDVVVIRPMFWIGVEDTCNNTRAAVLETGSYGLYAEQILEKWGHIDKIVVLVNWEADWQLRGVSCREDNECVNPIWDDWYTSREDDGCIGECKAAKAEDPTACWLNSCGVTCKIACCNQARWERLEDLRYWFNDRQRGVEEARAKYPESKMTILHGIVVNHTSNDWVPNVTRDLIPTLEYQPDLIGVSHWDKDQDITQALDYVKNHTGHVYTDIFVAEIGAVEAEYGDQYERIMDQGTKAIEWGSNLVLVWTWKQYNDPDGRNFGMWERDNGVPTDVPTSGLSAVLELINKYEHRNGTEE